jgi:glycyl-tRNA synthetase
MPDTTTFTGEPFNRGLFESLLKRRLFFTESFEIYRASGCLHGDNRGLFDYDPPGSALQVNIVDVWRRHFVLEEDMLEVDCTSLTPEEVFKTSGHVDKFEDWMCKDSKTGEFLRADHLVENVLEARLKGDKAARGVAIDAEEKSDAQRQRGKIKDVKSARFSDSEVQEYEETLAKVSRHIYSKNATLYSRKTDWCISTLGRSTTTTVLN